MKKLIYSITILLISFLINSSTYSQSTVSIRLGPDTGQDCLVASNFPNTAFPEHSDLAGLAGTVLGEYYAGRSFFRFDLSEIPFDSVVIEAKLSLFANLDPANNPHDGLNRSYIRRVTSPWVDADVTFDNQPDFTHAHEVLLEQSISPDQDYTNINVTAIQNISTEIPKTINLYQNFPNPFNPVTNVKFDVAKSSVTKISIYNELGKEVSTLANERLNPGSYQVRWDGSKFSSGAYFIKLESDDILITKKIILLK